MTPSHSGDSLPPTREIARALESGDLEAAARHLTAAGPLYGLPGGTGSSDRTPGAEGATGSDARSGPNARRGGGLTADGDFVPFYFTDPERAERYAEKHAFLGPDEEASPPRHDDSLVPLRDAFERGFAGVVIDPGSGRPLPLSRETIEEILVRSGEAEGENAEEKEPERGEPADQESPSADVASEGTRPEETDADAPDIRARRRATPPPPHLLDLVQRVRRSPTLEPVPPPATPAAEAREIVQELRQLVMEDRIPLWEVVDTLAFEMTFHVPVAPEPAHGLRWPLLVRHPRDPTTPSVWIFTDPEMARRSLTDVPGNAETLRLSGLEAFRWIWATPTPVQEVVIDLYPDSPPPLFVPDTWMVGAVFPHFLDCPDLRRVRRIPLEQIGGVPGARGTKMECVRALTEPWTHLTGPGPDPAGRDPSVSGSAAEASRSEAGGARLVRHEGSRYLPAASAGPWSRAASPPFRSWLRGSTDCSGVLLDPDGPDPLPLDHADLAILTLWAESGTQPEGADLARLVEDLRDDLGPAVSGRILADWPRYFWALQGDGDEQPTRAMTLPERDTCPVFTNEEGIRSFLDEARSRGLVSGEMQALAYISGWAFNVFREIHVRYREGGWLDPDALHPESGLELDEDVVRSALARIEWRLQPRIAGFLANR